MAIVGAGSAGWLTALALNTYCPFLKTKLIRPSKGSAIGVGESTQGDFVQLLQAARIDLRAFYEACDATMKCGIFYRDWNEVGKHYWHPFSDISLGQQFGPDNLAATYTVAHHYQQLISRHRGSHTQYYRSVHTSYKACVKNKHVAPESAVAFHVDAHKIADFLESYLTKVEVLEADDLDVQVEDGRIGGIVLDRSRTISADLYVDCTGFARALHKRIATPEVLPYEANVNRAVAAQVPYLSVEKEITPYTGAHAHEHGWTWSIPLRSRIGSGYVYHGDFCTDEQAERNFREYWGEERMRDVEIKRISFDSASLRNPWVKNVIAIGLSAGFIEPLEATGLNWTLTSGQILCQSLAARYYDGDTSAKYNFNMLGYVYDVQDFIDVHYKLSERRDTEFWKYHTSREYPDRLEQRLALYAAEMPTNRNRIKATPWAFSEVSWLDILNGYNFRYAKIDIDPRVMESGDVLVRAIAKREPQGIPPLQCSPPPDAHGPQILLAQRAG
ncbi:MAG TPA: tryptophan 7-halogenase [Gammaproteobacteria bacterium]|nr:tryptophan 7-halogenase [Gammaproteobacteria bacterium]